MSVHSQTMQSALPDRNPAWRRGVVRAFTLACLAAPGVTFADSPAFNADAVIRATDAVVAEHRVYATCLALDGQGLALVRENWRREVAQAVDALRDLKSPALFALRFSEATDFSRLLDGDMKLSAAMEFCQKNEKTTRKFYELGYTRLASTVTLAARQPARK